MAGNDPTKGAFGRESVDAGEDDSISSRNDPAEARYIQKMIAERSRIDWGKVAANTPGGGMFPT